MKALIAAVFLLLLASCGSAVTGDPSEPEVITLSVMNYIPEHGEYILNAFMETEEGANVRFNLEEYPSTDVFNQKIRLLISAGDLPDIIHTGGNNITEAAVKAGKVADLTPFFDADPAWRALFDERSLKFNMMDGRIYGVPISKEISYIYYNKELFAQAGVTAPEISFADWDVFFAACDTLKQAGITPLGMDSADFGWLSNLWFAALISTQSEAGEVWTNTQYPTDYNTTEVIASAGTLRRMLSEYTTSDAIGAKYELTASHFFNGSIAMITNGPWMIPDIKTKAPPGFYDKVGVMLMPGGAMGMVPTPGNMVGAKSEEKINAAAAFLKFSTSLENQIKTLEMTGMHPVSPNIEIPEALKRNDPLMASALDIQKHARVTYGQNQAYWFQNTTDVFTANLPRLAYGSMTPEEFCEALTIAAQINLSQSESPIP